MSDPHKKNHVLFQKRIPLWHLFLLCSYFCAHPTTLLLKILGGRMHGPSRTLNLGGPSPSPHRSPPLYNTFILDDVYPHACNAIGCPAGNLYQICIILYIDLDIPAIFYVSSCTQMISKNI